MERLQDRSDRGRGDHVFSVPGSGRSGTRPEGHDPRGRDPRHLLGLGRSARAALQDVRSHVPRSGQRPPRPRRRDRDSAAERLLPRLGARDVRPLDPAGRDLVRDHAPDAGRRKQGPLVRQVARETADADPEEGHVQGRRRRGRGEGRAAGDHRVSEGPAEVPEAGRQDPQGSPPDGTSRDRQDAARALGRGRSERSVFHDLRLRLRRDVRGSGRVPRTRPLRAGEEECALHHLHRRDRRRRQAPRRGPGRRPRRARADIERPPRRDGRLRYERRGHPRRGDQPAGRARPGAPAAGAVRPPRRRGSARPARPGTNPEGPHARDPALGERGSLDHRARHAGIFGRGPGEPRQRGSVERGAVQQERSR